jgi:DnaK suppressor protein
MTSPKYEQPEIEAVRTSLLAERRRLLIELSTLDAAELALGAAMRAEGGATGDPADIASDLVEQAVDEAVERTANDRLTDVDGALRRIEAGGYGRCEECGREIDPARLEALPWARRCLPCQRKLECARPKAHAGR